MKEDEGSGYRWKDNIKVDFVGMVWELVAWIQLFQNWNH